MVDHIVDASERRGRMDIRIGVGRRRRWSVEAKGRVVAESYAPGAVVSEVARRHEIAPQHLFAWRKAARSGRLALPVDAAMPMFVPVVTAKGQPDAAGGIANRGSIDPTAPGTDRSTPSSCASSAASCPPMQHRIMLCSQRESTKRNCKILGSQAPNPCNLKCRRIRKTDSSSIA